MIQYNVIDRVPSNYHTFSDFIVGLLYSTEDNDVLSLANTPNSYLFNESMASQSNGNKMYLRNCYRELTHEMHSIFRRGHCVLFTGTPGVGTTYFRNVVLKSILHMPFEANRTTRVIIVQESSNSAGYFVVMTLVDDTTVEISINYSNVVTREVHACRECYYLVDCTNGNIDKMAGIDRTIHHLALFCSPNQSVITMVVFKLLGTQLYLPLWRLDELLQAQAALDVLNPGEVRRRYRMMGGVVRCVLCRCQDSFDHLVNDYLPTFVLTDAHMVMWPSDYGIVYSSALIPDKLKYFEVPQTSGLPLVDAPVEQPYEYNYRKVTIQWAPKFLSSFMARELQYALKRKLCEEERAYLPEYKDPSISLSYLVKLYVSELLSRKGTSSMIIKHMKVIHPQNTAGTNYSSDIVVRSGKRHRKALDEEGYYEDDLEKCKYDLFALILD